MGADLTAAPLPQFSIGRVLKDSLVVLTQNFVRFGFVALVWLLLWAVVAQIYEPAAQGSAGEFSWWNFAIELLARCVIGGAVDAALVYGALQSLSGNSLSLEDFVRGAFFAAPIMLVNAIVHLPFAASTLLWAGNPDQAAISLPLWAGLICGYLLLTMWFLAAPVIITEGLGVLKALRRSASLTVGARWRVLAMILLLVLVTDGSSAAIATVDNAATSTAEITADMIVLALAYWTFTYLLPAFAVVFGAVLMATSYCTLRAVKEGTSIQEIARVPD